jgi:hypothetical protein
MRPLRAARVSMGMTAKRALEELVEDEPDSRGFDRPPGRVSHEGRAMPDEKPRDAEPTCCSAEAQATCCEPGEKAACCGGQHASGRCACQ